MKNTLVFLLFLSITLTSFAQMGKVYDNLSMNSDILETERKYALYLPPDYDISERSYPVLYLLHGGGDDQTGWVQFGEVMHIADKAIKEGKATPMIIVMPDANTGRRGYMNSPDGSWRYEDFFFEEFIPFIENTYRIKQQKRYRAVAGLSMGGGGSFYFALHRPELFSAACPLSAATGPATLEVVKRRYIRPEDKVSDEQIQDFYNRYNVVELVKSLPEDELKSVRWYIDCGDDDFLYEGNSLVHIEMRKREIPHEFRIRDGAHNWTYWRESLPEVLEFVSMGFHQY